MNTARRCAAAVLATLVVAVPGLVVTAQTSSANVTSIPTTLQAVVSRVVIGNTVRLRGTTSHANRRVVLQKWSDGRWRRVARTWSSDGRFRFTPRVRSGRTTFRAVSTRRVLADGTVLRRTVARPVTVRGLTNPIVISPNLEAARLTRARFNARRQALGIPGFAPNACLALFAAAHSARMMRYDVFEHSSHNFFTSRRHPSYGDVCPGTPRSRGEIIAKVHASSAQEAAADAYAAWMSSPPHREIIEWRQGRAFQVGVGFARAPDGAWWATAVIAVSY